MLNRPRVHTQLEAVNKELSQQLKTTLAGLNTLDILTNQVAALEETNSVLETKISNIAKVVKLQQDYVARQESLILALQAKVTALETNEKVVADLAYRISSLESKQTVKVEERLQAIEERVSALMRRQPTPEAGLERKIAATITATSAREDLFHSRVESAIDGLRRDLDLVRTTMKGSPRRTSTERLQRLEQEIGTKASATEVQRLGEILDREIRSRESSLLDSWQRVDSLEGNKSGEMSRTQEKITVSAAGLSGVSRHLGSGGGSFGVSSDDKENLPSVPKKKPKKPVRSRPRSQVSRRVCHRS